MSSRCDAADVFDAVLGSVAAESIGAESMLWCGDAVMLGKVRRGCHKVSWTNLRPVGRASSADS